MQNHIMKNCIPNIASILLYFCILSYFFQLPAMCAPLHIGSGTYDQTIEGPASLSGNIAITMTEASASSSRGIYGLYARNGNAITGTVQRLAVATAADYASGISSAGSLIDLTGSILVQTNGAFAYGVAYNGNPGGGGLRFDGNASIATTGDYAYGVFAMGSQKDYALVAKGTLAISTSGAGSCGIYLNDGAIRLDSNTSIVTSGEAAHGIYASTDGRIQLNGPTRIATTGNNAYALLADGLAPYSESFISTRQNATDAPNPQQIYIEGPMRIYGKGNELLLDLAAGSHVNSRVLEADNGGSVILNFFAPDAQWTTGQGSVISNDSQLRLDFTQGGIWNLPVTDQENLSLAQASPALIIKDTANMTIEGSTIIRGAMNTTMASGDSARFALVQAQGSNALDPDLFSMGTASNNILYSLDKLERETVNGYETLVATVTRKKLADTLPALGDDAGNLLPDGGNSFSGDDGNSNPFLAAILAQHVNNLSLEDITTYIESAPAMTRVLPISAITRNLSTRVRSKSPAAAATGSGPGPQYINSSASKPHEATHRALPADSEKISALHAQTREPAFRVWASPVYMHDSEHGLKTEKLNTGYRANIWGVLAGADISMGPWTIGGGFSFGTGKARSHGGDMARTKSDIEYAGALLYGIWSRDDWVFSMEGVYMRTRNDIRQPTPIMELTSQIYVDAFSAEFLAGRRFLAGGFQIMPNIGVHYSRLIQRNATIKGRVDGRTHSLFENGEATQNIWDLPVGVQISRSFQLDDTTITPMLQARYIAALGDRNMDIRAWRSDAPSISTVMEGATTDRHTGEISAGLSIAGKRTHVYLGYSYQGSKHRNAHMLTGTIGCTF